MEAYGVRNALLVEPNSGYNEDNRCLLDAIAHGGGRFKGIAVVPAGTSRAALAALQAQGIVGIAFNAALHGTAYYQDIGPLLAHLEALVRSRQSPYLCKISRESPQALEAEMISACDYLDDPRENCTLHGRQRADGRTAKPDLCSEWPDDGKGLHPGCLWYTPPARKAAKRQ